MESRINASAFWHDNRLQTQHTTHPSCTHKHTHTHTRRDRQATTPLKFHSPPLSLASSYALATAPQAGKQKELKVQDEIVVHVSMLQCFLPLPLHIFFYFAFSLSVVAATAGGAAIQASLGRSCCSGSACIPAGPGRADPGWPRLEWELE